MNQGGNRRSREIALEASEHIERVTLRWLLAILEHGAPLSDHGGCPRAVQNDPQLADRIRHMRARVRVAPETPPYYSPLEEGKVGRDAGPCVGVPDGADIKAIADRVAEELQRRQARDIRS